MVPVRMGGSGLGMSDDSLLKCGSTAVVAKFSTGALWHSTLLRVGSHVIDGFLPGLDMDDKGLLVGSGVVLLGLVGLKLGWR
jgi:hypothetical protein